MVPLPPALAWSVLSPSPGDALELPRWMAVARAHFDAELGLGDPAADAGVWTLTVAPAREVARAAVVRLRTIALAEAPAVLAAARRGCEAIGGAGMDALVARAVRVWQVEDDGTTAPLVLAGVLASALLGPVVPPGEVTIFGVRGARARLAARGWG